MAADIAFSSEFKLRLNPKIICRNAEIYARITCKILLVFGKIIVHFVQNANALPVILYALRNCR